MTAEAVGDTLLSFILYLGPRVDVGVTTASAEGRWLGVGVGIRRDRPA